MPAAYTHKVTQISLHMLTWNITLFERCLLSEECGPVSDNRSPAGDLKGLTSKEDSDMEYDLCCHDKSQNQMTQCHRSYSLPQWLMAECTTLPRVEPHQDKLFLPVCNCWGSFSQENKLIVQIKKHNIQFEVNAWKMVILTIITQTEWLLVFFYWCQSLENWAKS